MAATDQGLVVFDPNSGAILASAETLHRVIDLAHDPWRDRWIVAEYDDDSENRVSVWRLDHGSRRPWRLQLDHTIETGGYCRVIAGRSSTVVFEHDGMHQRWRVWDAQAAEHGSSVQAAIPAGVIARSDAAGSELLSVSIADDGSGPRAMLHRARAQGPTAGPVASIPMPAWSGVASPLRAAEAGPGRIALAQVRQGRLDLGLIADDGQMVRETIQWDLHAAESAEAVIVDEARAIAFVAVSRPDRVIAIDLDHGALLDQQGCEPLPAANAPWFSRLLAYDAVRGRLIVGGMRALQAWDLSGTRTLEKVEGWEVAGAHRPVALSASTYEPSR